MTMTPPVPPTGTPPIPPSGGPSAPPPPSGTPTETREEREERLKREAAERETRAAAADADAMKEMIVSDKAHDVVRRTLILLIVAGLGLAMAMIEIPDANKNVEELKFSAKQGWGITGAIIAMLAGGYLWVSFEKIDAAELGVVKRWGRLRSTVLRQGPHFVFKGIWELTRVSIQKDFLDIKVENIIQVIEVPLLNDDGSKIRCEPARFDDDGQLIEEYQTEDRDRVHVLPQANLAYRITLDRAHQILVWARTLQAQMDAAFLDRIHLALNMWIQQPRFRTPDSYPRGDYKVMLAAMKELEATLVDADKFPFLTITQCDARGPVAFVNEALSKVREQADINMVEQQAEVVKVQGQALVAKASVEVAKAKVEVAKYTKKADLLVEMQTLGVVGKDRDGNYKEPTVEDAKTYAEIKKNLGQGEGMAKAANVTMFVSPQGAPAVQPVVQVPVNTPGGGSSTSGTT